MKNIENNGALKKVVALLLVTTMVVGLLSSAAIKLVASTYYMQNKRKLKTNIPVVDQVIDAVVDDGNVAGPETITNSVTAPATTVAPTTEAPSTEAPTDSASDSTDASANTTTTTAPSGDGGSGGGDILGTITGLLGGIDIGGLIGGIDIGGLLGGLGGSGEETTETTESTTESEEAIKQKKEILTKYNTVVNYAKTVGKPAFTKVTYRTLDKGFDAILLNNTQSANPEYFVSKDNAEASPIVVPANTATSELLINNDKYAGMLASADAAAAIESATSVKLEDGSQKITITLREEADPAVTAVDAKEAASFTSSMFPVITGDEFGEMVKKGLSLASVSSSNVTYKNCTVELIFNPVLNRIISIKQITSYEGVVKGSILSSKGTVTEISEYRDFDYGLI